jgi:hypothetical protein
MESYKIGLVFCVAAAFVVGVACGTSPMATGYVSGDEPYAADGSAGDVSAPADDSDAEPAGWTPFLKGALAVESRGCPKCHQSTNPEDGVLSGQLTPVPGTRAYGANLTPDLESGIGALTDDEVLRAIRSGTDDENASLCSAMPRFSDVGEDEGGSIVAYLRGLVPVKRAIPDSECEADGGEDASADADTSAGANVDAGANADASVNVDAGANAGANVDAGAKADASSCSGLASPTVLSACHACETRPCQLNGCFGGYWCDTTTWTCHPKPPMCL